MDFEIYNCFINCLLHRSHILLKYLFLNSIKFHLSKYEMIRYIITVVAIYFVITSVIINSGICLYHQKISEKIKEINILIIGTGFYCQYLCGFSVLMLMPTEAWSGFISFLLKYLIFYFISTKIRLILKVCYFSKFRFSST